MEGEVEVGPFCVIKGKTTIGAGTKLYSHVVLGDDRTDVVIGKNNHFHPGSVIGGVPQDLTYKEEINKLVMGDNNIIREFVTVNVGTTKGGGVTRIGSNCMLMAYVHIAHDCILGNHVVMANSCQLAGHVIMDDYARIGGGCLFNQFVVLGKFCYIAGASEVNKDVPPFSIAQGKYAVVRAANEIGMDRAGFTKPQIDSVRRAVRILTKGGGTLEESLKRIDEECEKTDTLNDFMGFVRSPERKRGLAL